jgi:hypothetical protein
MTQYSPEDGTGVLKHVCLEISYCGTLLLLTTTPPHSIDSQKVRRTILCCVLGFQSTYMNIILVESDFVRAQRRCCGKYCGLEEIQISVFFNKHNDIHIVFIYGYHYS